MKKRTTFLTNPYWDAHEEYLRKAPLSNKEKDEAWNRMNELRMEEFDRIQKHLLFLRQQEERVAKEIQNNPPQLKVWKRIHRRVRKMIRDEQDFLMWLHCVTRRPLWS